MPKINILFIYNEGFGIQEKLFEYEDICTIKEMLEDFLRKTNSKKTLAPSDICFIYNAKILNNERFLNKRLKEVFKESLNRIIVKDYCDIIGYNNKICHVKFVVPEIRIFQYENTCTIKEMLEDFLRKTNSKITLAPSDIYFIYHSIILNNEGFLNKRLKEVFKKKKNLIKVIETPFVIG